MVDELLKRHPEIENIDFGENVLTAWLRSKDSRGREAAVKRIVEALKIRR
jgi:hypothetical protein